MVDRADRNRTALIRANLLPRPKESVALVGMRFEREYLRAALLGLSAVALVTLLGAAIERLRLARLDTAVLASERSIQTSAPERTQAKELALEVARYQAFARQAALFRRSGSDAAIALARIGNGVPPGVWVDEISHEAGNYDLSGGSRSVARVSATILSLGNVLPGAAASLVDVQDRAQDGVRFSARIAVPTTAPSNVPETKQR